MWTKIALAKIADLNGRTQDRAKFLQKQVGLQLSSNVLILFLYQVDSVKKITLFVNYGVPSLMTYLYISIFAFNMML